MRTDHKKESLRNDESNPQQQQASLKKDQQAENAETKILEPVNHAEEPEEIHGKDVDKMNYTDL